MGTGKKVQTQYVLVTKRYDSYLGWTDSKWEFASFSRVVEHLKDAAKYYNPAPIVSITKRILVTEDLSGEMVDKIIAQHPALRRWESPPIYGGP